MSDRPTRRRLLQSAVAAGALAGVGALGTRESVPQVQLLEAGLRVSVPAAPSYQRAHHDTPSSYAVDDVEGTIRLRRGPEGSWDGAVSDGSRLLGGRPVTDGALSVQGTGQAIRSLPVALSPRKRVSETVALESPLSLPPISIQWETDPPTATVGADGDAIAIEPGTSRRVALAPERVTARTATLDEAQASLEGVPDWQVGRRQESRTQTVEVKPFVEFRHFGPLRLLGERRL